MLLSFPSYSGATSEASRDFHITTTGGWLVSTRLSESFVFNEVKQESDCLRKEANVEENRQVIVTKIRGILLRENPPSTRSWVAQSDVVQ
jgi:hypothetical protein